MVGRARSACARILALKFLIDRYADSVVADRRDKQSARRFWFDRTPTAGEHGYTPDPIAITGFLEDV